MKNANIVVSEIVSAFNLKTIGTKVVKLHEFHESLRNAIANYTFPENGQGFIPMPAQTYSTVTSGVAKREGLTENDFVVRSHRGNVSLFAKREHAASVESLNVIVYTKKAYLADPEVSEEEAKRFVDSDFVIVAVLASAGPKPPVGAFRFCSNLGGGNNRYKPENGYTILQAVEEAKQITEYENTWVTVAD